MRSHSTKFQLKEKSLDANFILSNTLHALLLFKIQKSSVSVSFAFVSSSHAWTVHLARSSQPLPPVRSFTRVRGAFLASVAASLAGVGSFCGGCTSRGGQQGPEPSRHATRRRPRPLGFPRVPVVPAHARGTVAVARQARNVLPAADGPAPPRSVELAHSTKSQPD